ncbi:MAG: hypothetical protein DRN04_16620 [Thermoprotei archaeon]|mgnify:CR=1 FL=1|nr:MAG: hypothetical protein DRN04_16620 [Thermoprotei archaeon]
MLNVFRREAGDRRNEPIETIKGMRTLKNWLQNYVDVVEKLEEEYGEAILKLVDEGLYIMCTVSLRKRVNLLSIHFERPAR